MTSPRSSTTSPKLRLLAVPMTALSLATALLLTGCGTAGTLVSPEAADGAAGVDAGTGTATGTTAGWTSQVLTDEIAEATHYDADDTDYAEEDLTEVSLEGTGASATGADADTVAVSEQDGEPVLTISGSGTYRLSGAFDGTVVVASGEEDAVQVILDGADIASSNGPALRIDSADEVTVLLAEGSENTLTDAVAYADTSTEAADAALYSKADLTIAGSGSLAVEGQYLDAIHSTDGLVIDGAAITVQAADDGIVGKDYVALLSGTVQVTAAQDGVKSSHDEDLERGWLSVYGGDLRVAAGDDGVKAETTLAISGGTVTVTESTEGLEAYALEVTGGTTTVNASDDGVNASGGAAAAEGGQSITVTGGSLTITAEGDGLDSNGDAAISGGTVVVNGPEGDGNGAIDVAGSFTVTGGALAAAGSAGMAQGLGGDSTQGGLQVDLPETVEAGTTLLVADADGTVVATFTAAKRAASLVLSVEGIEDGAEYTVYSAAGGLGEAGLMSGQSLDDAVSVDGATELVTVTAGEYSAGMGGPGGAPAGGMGGMPAW